MPTPPPHASSHRDLIRLVLGVLASRPPWLGVCRWCLDVIYRSDGDRGPWLHVHHGTLLCQHPRRDTPPHAMAAPLRPDTPPPHDDAGDWAITALPVYLTPSDRGSPPPRPRPAPRTGRTPWRRPPRSGPPPGPLLPPGA